MTQGRLITWLKAGYPYLKAGSGLPSWLLPERSLRRTADELGDGSILRMSQPLQLTKGIEAVFDQALDPASFTPEAWQEAVKRWPPLSQVRPVVEAFLEVAGRVRAQFRRIRSGAAPMVICRHLAVLLFAPFIPEGRPVLEELAPILGGSASEPAELIRSYAEAVIDEDAVVVEKVSQCILKYSAWAEWASVLEEETLKCRYTPSLITVTPPPSAELVDALALMIKEAQHDEPRGDNSEHPGGQVRAQ
jgi:hypothetical protein